MSGQPNERGKYIAKHAPKSEHNDHGSQQPLDAMETAIA